MKGKTASPDEQHIYGPGQAGAFGNALIQAGVQCHVYRDENGDLVREYDCKAPRRRAPNVQLDPSVRRPGSSPDVRALRTGRAPREATNTRARGSRRGSRATSSSSDDPEPEPPPRVCQYGKCGEPIDHLRAGARYCGDKHRVYAQRERDREQPGRLAERAAANGTPGTPAPCQCSPTHNVVDRGMCVICGRARGAVTVAWLTEARDLRSRQLVSRSPARRNPRYGDRKPKPVTERKVRPVAA